MPNFTQLFGWDDKPAEVATVLSRQTHPMFGPASAKFGSKGVGAGKRVLLYEALYKAIGGRANYRPRLQTIGDCVSHGAANAVDVLNALLVITGKSSWIAETASEPLYAMSRVEIGGGRLGSGDGSVGAWAAEAVKTLGTLARQVYGRIDLTKYDGNRAKQWGMPRAGCPDELEPTARQQLVRTTSLITTWEECRDAIAAGYPVTVASNQGFTTTRDKDGFCRPSGTWPHQMCVWGIDDTSRRPGGLIINSWGPDWVSGPTQYDQPEGSFWADAATLERMFRQQDSWAFSEYDGFPPKKFDLGSIF